MEGMTYTISRSITTSNNVLVTEHLARINGQDAWMATSHIATEFTGPESVATVMELNEKAPEFIYTILRR